MALRPESRLLVDAKELMWRPEKEADKGKLRRCVPTLDTGGQNQAASIRCGSSARWKAMFLWHGSPDGKRYAQAADWGVSGHPMCWKQCHDVRRCGSAAGV